MHDLLQKHAISVTPEHVPKTQKAAATETHRASEPSRSGGNRRPGGPPLELVLGDMLEGLRPSLLFEVTIKNHSSGQLGRHFGNAAQSRLAFTCCKSLVKEKEKRKKHMVVNNPRRRLCNVWIDFLLIQVAHIDCE